MQPTVHTLFENLPEKFQANRLDALTDGAFRWRTIKNLRSRGIVPEECFVKVSPRKIFILRDAFFDWAEAYSH